MYRFFCTTCNKIKRVQHMPRVISHPTSTDVTSRKGVCDRHSLPITQNQNQKSILRKVAK